MHISVVIPVYGCRGCLEELHRRLVESLKQITEEFEIILVNDACPQNSWEVIAKIAGEDKRVVGVNLARNFGQIRAITAGLERAKGKWIVVMDCDLQDKPEEIHKLYEKAQEGYECVFARRRVRKHSLVKRIGSKLFYMTYRYFTDGAYDDSVCNFSISRDYVMANYLKLREQNRAFVMFIRWMGFGHATVEVEHAERAMGKSSYSLGKQMKMASEIITSQSNKPLILSIKMGFTCALLALLTGVYFALQFLIHGVSVSGWTSTIVSIYFVGGILLANLGILGLYIGYVFNQTKDRPLYIVRETIENGERLLGGVRE